LRKPLKTCFRKVYEKAKKPCAAWWLFSICRTGVKGSMNAVSYPRQLHKGLYPK
jgi:hypothetical protein